MAVGYRKRWEVLQRDGFTCQYCGAQPPDARLQVDHITPRSKGGRDTIDNLITACTPCNQGKSALELAGYDNRLQEELQETIREYTDNPIHALTMIRNARAHALEMLLMEFDAIWGVSMWDVGQIDPPTYIDMYLLLGDHDLHDVQKAVFRVAHELEASGEKPKTRQVLKRVQEILRGA
jgi:hypothetical protein